MGLRRAVATLAACLAGCAIVAGLGHDYRGAALDADAAPPQEAAPPQDAAPQDAAPPVTPSCRDLYAAAASTRGNSDFYTIAPDGGPFRVYCEMSIDDGGWTLVARSAPNGTGTFGWHVTTGQVDDPYHPYSIDALDAGLPFNEVMIADRVDGGFGVATHAYKVHVRDVDVAQHPNDAVSTAGVTTVFGDCSDAGKDGPQMLKWAGFTSIDDAFFLRDIAGLDQHKGLRADRIDLTYPDCRGGLINGTQGLLFVR